jgi:hypothetical protein
MDFTSASPTAAPTAVLDLRSSAVTPPSDAYSPATAVTPPDAGTRAQPHHGFRPGADGRGTSAVEPFNPYQEWDGDADGWIDDPRHFLDERRRHYEDVWRALEAGIARAQAEARQARLDALAAARREGAPAATPIATAPVAARPSDPVVDAPIPAPDRARITLVELPDPAHTDMRAAASAYSASAHAIPPSDDRGIRYL